MNWACAAAVSVSSNSSDNQPLRAVGRALRCICELGLEFVFVFTEVSSQAKVTVPPPAIAARKGASVQVVTTPPAQAATGKRSSNARAPLSPPLLSFINDRFAYWSVVFIERLLSLISCCNCRVSQYGRFGSGTQLNGTTRLTSLEDVAGVDEETGGEIYFHDVLSRDEEDPGTKAARSIDWADFVAALPERERAIIQFIIEGKSICSMARKLKVCDWTIRNSKENLALKILEFMGCEILVDIQRSPRWKQDLTAVKEKMACREERRH